MRPFDPDYFKHLQFTAGHHALEVSVGNLIIGGDHPVVVQSMANTDTTDIDATVKQCIALFDAGCELVRVTVPGKSELISLEKIKSRLMTSGYDLPLAADIHFSPDIAVAAAGIVEKVRINPGNFAEKSRASGTAYDPGQYMRDLENAAQKILPLVEKCKRHGTALRIGVNHGSLSARIMDRYGDTPEGMVASAMEFLSICREMDFHNIVVSLKSSRAFTMVRANRILAAAMRKEGMAYPIHLGVTEAGSEDEGRVRSALGIGTLLAEGIGDTIRVSLTGDPLPEIPFARKLRQIYGTRQPEKGQDIIPNLQHPLLTPPRREIDVEGTGRTQYPLVVARDAGGDATLMPDLVFSGEGTFKATGSSKTYPFNVNTPSPGDWLVIDPGSEAGYPGFLRNCSTLSAVPVILRKSYGTSDAETMIIQGSVDFGAALADGCGDGIWIRNENFPTAFLSGLSYQILQAAGLRVSSAEFVACPSCGRTRFDISRRLAQVKERFSHLKGIRIAVMGCIVNGPGEMAGADYGYVGAGQGKVSLYHKDRQVMKNLDENLALEELEKMIRDQGDWVEP